MRMLATLCFIKSISNLDFHRGRTWEILDQICDFIRCLFSYLKTGVFGTKQGSGRCTEHGLVYLSPWAPLADTFPLKFYFSWKLSQIPVKAQEVQTGKAVPSPSHVSNDHLQLLFWKKKGTKEGRKKGKEGKKEEKSVFSIHPLRLGWGGEDPEPMSQNRVFLKSFSVFQISVENMASFFLQSPCVFYI